MKSDGSQQTGEPPTHCYGNAEEATNAPIYQSINLFIFRMCTIQFPESVLTHAQAEEIWLSNYEIQVLIIKLSDTLGGATFCNTCSEVLHQRPWNRGEEVDIGISVETFGKIFIDKVEICPCWLDQIENRYIRYRMPLGIDVAVSVNRWHSCLSVRVLSYRCMVIPHARRSLTLSTLLMTSLPRSSNTNTFHIGSPSEFRMGVECSPLIWEGS